MKEENSQYLKEDQDILNSLDLIKPVYMDQEHQQNLASLQIKSILRSRKTMVDLDKSNKKLSTVFFFFTIIQTLVAGLSFILEIKNYPDQRFAVFVGLGFIAVLVWLYKISNKIFREDEKA
jgi:hypothetical protein